MYGQYFVASTHSFLLAASLSQKNEYFIVTVAYAGAIIVYYFLQPSTK